DRDRPDPSGMADGQDHPEAGAGLGDRASACRSDRRGRDSERQCRRASRRTARLTPRKTIASFASVKSFPLTRRWGNGPRPAFQASRASYGAIWWRASRDLLGRRAVVPHTDGVAESRDEPRSKHRGETTMEHYAGIDVSLEYSSVCVVDGTGKIVREGKVASEPAALIVWFGSLGFGLVRIGLE